MNWELFLFQLAGWLALVYFSYNLGLQLGKDKKGYSIWRCAKTFVFGGLGFSLLISARLTNDGSIFGVLFATILSAGFLGVGRGRDKADQSGRIRQRKNWEKELAEELGIEIQTAESKDGRCRRTFTIKKIPHTELGK